MANFKDFFLFFFIEFIIDRSEKNGGRIVYKNFDEIFEAFRTEILHPGDLKLGVEAFINRLLDPIRKKFESKELKKLAAEAYPSSKRKSFFVRGTCSYPGDFCCTLEVIAVP